LEDHAVEKQRFKHSLWFASLFILILFSVKGIESIFDLDFTDYGLYPLNFKGLRGIILSPLIHGSWEHLINNSIPLFVLTVTLFYFYREISYRVFFLIYGVHGFWLWFLGRHSYHIGASGIIYGLGSFLFVSGLIRKNSNLMAISLLVVFLYGSMVWGIFPLIETVSWEGHLTGMAAGIIFAFFYRQYGPPPNFGKRKDEQTEDDIPSSEDADESYLEELENNERNPRVF
jgi:membrane associated rhomboid family serine protease